ncbi:MAG: hypothetical protein ABIC04_00800 [Nanoarchaeota archaeon]
MASSILTKKSQIWGLDLIVGLLIFTGALIFFYKYTINTVDSDKHNVDDIIMEARLISSYLTSTGYPANWSLDDVTLIGLTDGGVNLLDSKVSEFSQIVSLDYTNSRKLLSTGSDYNVSFFSKDDVPYEISGISSIGKNSNNESVSNLIQVVRFLVHDSNIIKVVVQVW